MAPVIPTAPELPDTSGSAWRVFLTVTLFTLVAIALFPYVRVYDTFYLAGILLPDYSVPINTARQWLFLPCLLVCLGALAPHLVRWARGIGRRAWLETLVLALAVYALLAVFAFPYPYPTGTYSSPAGLGGIGRWYGEMAAAPFEAVSELGYRRLLMPAIAYYLGLTTPLAYYVYSQVLGLAVIALTIRFFDEKVPALTSWPALARVLGYASLSSCSYVVYNSQMPGYPDILLHALLLLMVLVPMPRQGRLTLIALCLVTHDGSMFGLAPLVLVAFPRKERLPALAFIAAYVLIWFSSYGGHLGDALLGHDVVGETSHRARYLTDPLVALAGVFFAWKLGWVAALACLATAARRSAELPATALLVVAPLAMLAVAWDTTRLAAFGIAGMFLVLAAAGRRWLPARPAAPVFAALAANLVIPTNNVVLARLDTAATYQYPGLYRLVYEWAARTAGA